MKRLLSYTMHIYVMQSTYLTFIGPCIVIYFYSKTNEMPHFLKCILFFIYFFIIFYFCSSTQLFFSADFVVPYCCVCFVQFSFECCYKNKEKLI